MTTKSTLDKLRSVADAGRVSSATADLLSDLEGVRDWADALDDLSQSIEAANDALQEWIDAEDREEKAEARETAVDAVADVVQAWEIVEGLTAVDGVVAQP